MQLSQPLFYWREHKLLSAASAFGMAALLCAALNMFELAGWAAIGAGVATISATIAALYDRLPDDSKVSFWSRTYLRRTVMLSLIIAVVVSAGYWFLGWVPMDLSPTMIRALAAWFPKLDFIPSSFPWYCRSHGVRVFISTFVI